MLHELTNLLPKPSLRALRQDYFMRLATVATVLATLVVVAHGLLLMPSYIFLSQQVSEQEAKVAAFSNTQGSSQETEVNARIAALSTDATYLTRLDTVPSVSSALHAVLLVPRAGTTLNSITMTPSKGTANGRMMLSGKATTRETLRAFQAALQALPFVSNVDLPISSFAKETDIAFSITLTGTLTP